MHILTFDIEHWYESWRLRGLGGYENLPDCDSSLVERLLDLLDATGRKILGHLVKNARMSLKEIGERVSLSVPAVAERVQRMEEEGLI